MANTSNDQTLGDEQPAGLVLASVEKTMKVLQELHGENGVKIMRIISDDALYRMFAQTGAVPKHFFGYKLTGMRPNIEHANVHVARTSGLKILRTEEGTVTKLHFRPVIVDLTVSYITIDYKDLLTFSERLLLRDSKLSFHLEGAGGSEYDIGVEIEPDLAFNDWELDGDAGSRSRLDFGLHIKTYAGTFDRADIVKQIVVGAATSGGEDETETITQRRAETVSRRLDSVSRSSSHR